MPHHITILDDYQGQSAHLNAARQLPADAFVLDVESHSIAPCDLVTRLVDTDAVILIRERTTLTREILAALPRLKLVVQTGRLSSAIDTSACERLGIAVRDGHGSPIAPAELTWLLTLAAMRRLPGYLAQQAAGGWQRTRDRLADEALGEVVHGRTLGIWGLGRIGRRVADYGRAFGMTVIAHGRAGSAERAAEANIEFVADRSAFLGRCHILSLHIRLTEETRGMIGEKDLAALPVGALLVNTSRAELIEAGSLLAGLDAQHPAMAALDVFENEPAGAAPFIERADVLATPHIGFVEKDTYELYFDTAFAQVHEFFEGRTAR